MKSTAMLLAAAAAATLPLAAHAAVWDGTGGTPYSIPADGMTFGPGPEATPGVVWTSTNAVLGGGSVYGWIFGYSFGTNGFWAGTPMEGLNDSSDEYGVADSMTFTFAGPITAFGGEINWVSNNDPVTIAAYDSSGNLLDSLTLSSGEANLQTPDAFYGFIDSSADIKSFVLTDGYIGIENIESIGLSGGVPEPAAWAMMLLGFGAVGAAMRFSRQHVTA